MSVLVEYWYWLIAAIASVIFYIVEHKWWPNSDWLVKLGAASFSFFMGLCWPISVPGLIICLKFRVDK